MSFPRDKPQAAHHKGSHRRRAEAIVAAAYATPSTTCWRCGLTLDKCRPHRNGKPARWQAGHLIDGLKDGPLAAECSSCNTSAGARLGQQRSRRRRSRLAW